MYEGRQKVLGWFSLEKRRRRADLTSSNFAMYTVLLVYLLRNIFHHESGKSLEERLGGVAGSPALEIITF